MYHVKISYLKVYALIQTVIVLFFAGVFYFEGVTFGSPSDTALGYIFMGFISIIGALAATFMMSAMWSSTLTPDGIRATFGAVGTENLIKWEEINAITNNWMSPCYVVRDKTRLWPISGKELRQRMATMTHLRIAVLPKPFFLKDKRAFLAYLDSVLLLDNKLRNYYF